MLAQSIKVCGVYLRSAVCTYLYVHVARSRVPCLLVRLEFAPQNAFHYGGFHLAVKIRSKPSLTSSPRQVSPEKLQVQASAEN